MRIEIAGDSGLIVYFAEEISQEAATQVAAAYRHLQQLVDTPVIDLIPSYTSLLVVYDALQINYIECQRWLQVELARSLQAASTAAINQRVVEIPVYYGSEVGVDLEEVALQTGLTPAEVIRRHADQLYSVYAIGFAPGFAYLGLTPPELRVNRRITPRLKVPKGSVALADNQTAIYPSVSPGGWQIIGRTPKSLVDWSASPISPFTVGGSVKFQPVNREEFIQLGGTFDGF